jgi:predicted DNA-binding protein (UPF0251 family)
MPRPIKGRNVCCLPRSTRFGPLGQRGVMRSGVTMTVDEFETIRLIDYMNFTQEECALQMNVARTTVQGIYDQARKKLARALVDCVPLTISGGEYKLYGGSWDSEACRRGACNRHRGGWKEEEPQDTAPGEEET